MNPHFTRDLPMRLYETESSVASVVAEHGFAAAQVADFSLNVNPFGPPASAVTAATAVLGRSHAYPDVQLTALRRAVAQRHATPEANLLFGAGLDDVIKQLLHAWVAEGEAVLVHLPTFPRYELEARLRGCRVVTVCGPAPWRVDLEAIAEALARERITLAFLCSPNNPTGERIETASIAALADRAFLDDAFRRFRAEADRFCAGLAGLPVFRLRGRHANMLLVEVRERTARDVQRALETRGIVIADAACFGGMEGHEAIRISLQSEGPNDRLLAALGEVAAGNPGEVRP